MSNPIKKNIAYLFVALLLGSLLTAGVNSLSQNLEYYFFAQELQSDAMTAQLAAAEDKSPKPEKFEAELSASSAISVWTNLEDSKVLFQKNSSESLPIASISKLMTSFVVMDLQETYDLDSTITVSEESVEQDGNFNLRPGERLTVKNLLAMTLIESSNDAAHALADAIGEEGDIGSVTEKGGFVGLMNYYAEKMNLDQTVFYNPTGLENGKELENKSSAQDLVKLSKNILREHPKIFELSSQESYQVTKPDGSPHHFIEENTNELLGKVPNIIGGKTGYTDEAEQCLLTVVEDEEGEGYFINVILGSDDRFGEMEKLIEKEQ